MDEYKCMDEYGLILMNINVWMSMDRYWWVWIKMDEYGKVWTSMDKYGWVWTSMDEYKCMDEYGLV